MSGNIKQVTLHSFSNKHSFFFLTLVKCHLLTQILEIFNSSHGHSSLALGSSLDADHGKVDAFLCQQLLVGAALLDSAILKHHY